MTWLIRKTSNYIGKKLHFYFGILWHFDVDIYTTYLRKMDRLEKGKKNTVADEYYLNLAEKHLFSELCLVLGKDKEEIHHLILEVV